MQLDINHAFVFEPKQVSEEVNANNSAFLVHHYDQQATRSALVSLSQQTSVTLVDLFGIMRGLF